MSEFEKTARGFNVYGRVPTHAGGLVRVQDSSLAFEGPHVWLFLDGEQCTEHLGRHQKPDPQLSVEQAKQLRDALSAFIAAAESDELTEPVSETKGEGVSESSGFPKVDRLEFENEIEALSRISEAFELLSPEARGRVYRWLHSRFPEPQK